MQKRELLFDLIKSLSKSEKRYFRLFIELHVKGNQNEYSKLYDLLVLQKKYDEKKVKEYLKGENILKHFAEAKYYLQKIILKSLASYHSNLNVESQINEYLQQIKILTERELHELAFNIIQKAKKLATKHEKIIYLLIISYYELELIRLKADLIGVDELKLLLKEADKIQKLSYDFVSNKKLFLLFTRRRRSIGFTREKSELLILQEILENPDFKKPELINLFEPFYYFSICNSIYCRIVKNFKKADEYNTKLIERFESNPQLIKEYRARYIISITNALLGKSDLNRYDEIPTYIEKLRTLAHSIKEQKLKNNLNYLANRAELSTYISIGKFNSAKSIAAQLEKQLAEPIKFGIKKEHQIQEHLSLANYYFGIENYSSTLKHLNTIISKDENIRTDLHSIARIISIIVHFEKGNLELLDYTVKSVQRYLIKKGKLFAFEKEILSFIKSILSINYSDAKLTDAFKKLRVGLIKIKDDDFEGAALNYFHFIPWLDSKIKKKKFEEMIKEEFK